MMMNTLLVGIYNRVLADTGTGGLYQGSAFNIISGLYSVTGNPDSLVFPYVVVEIEAAQDDSQTSDDLRCSVTFKVYDYLSNGGLNITRVMDRIYGDAVLQSGRVPSYGFHRHTLSLPSDSYSSKGSMMLCQRQAIRPETENVMVGEMSFSVYVTAAAVSP